MVEQKAAAKVKKGGGCKGPNQASSGFQIKQGAGREKVATGGGDSQGKAGRRQKQVAGAQKKVDLAEQKVMSPPPDLFEGDETDPLEDPTEEETKGQDYTPEKLDEYLTGQLQLPHRAHLYLSVTLIFCIIRTCYCKPQL
jgi:hypothetical protein